MNEYLGRNKTEEKKESVIGKIKKYEVVDERFWVNGVKDSYINWDKRFEDSINEANEKEAKYMCEVLDIIENRGIEKALEKGLAEGLEKGRQEGADMVSKLNELLLNEGNIDKLRKANTDKDYRYKLLREYNILQ